MCDDELVQFTALSIKCCLFAFVGEPPFCVQVQTDNFQNGMLYLESRQPRCKKRKRLVKQTVAYRRNFAASHAKLISSLKGVGLAFRQFAEGEEMKDAGADMMCPPEAPMTSRTVVLSPGPPPLLPALSLTYGFSRDFTTAFPPHSSLQRNPSATRSLNSTAASSPESYSMDFLPPPPPLIANENRMENIPLSVSTKTHTSLKAIQVLAYEDLTNWRTFSLYL
uniref:DUF630 domain-containing protein n=1 Tax=Physcomitrium patens TaxID=3218 RepID=A0A2K1KIT4_PHYPA|nr:hypothetical protein PHYPA_007348 [Physcomitrium patens]